MPSKKILYLSSPKIACGDDKLWYPKFSIGDALKPYTGHEFSVNSK